MRQRQDDRQADLFERERARDRRVLARMLNRAARKRRRKALPALPLITVPGLDPLTGRRLT